MSDQLENDIKQLGDSIERLRSQRDELAEALEPLAMFLREHLDGIVDLTAADNALHIQVAAAEAALRRVQEGE